MMRPALLLAAPCLAVSLLLAACSEQATAPASTNPASGETTAVETAEPPRAEDTQPAGVPADAPADTPPMESAAQALAIPAAQADAPLRPSFEACIRNSGGVVPDMQDCIAGEYVFHDDRLNAAFRRLRAGLPATDADALRDAQRDWLKRRDAECTWDAATEGQGQRLAANECSLRWTAIRAAELEAMIR